MLTLRLLEDVSHVECLGRTAQNSETQQQIAIVHTGEQQGVFSKVLVQRGFSAAW